MLLRLTCSQLMWYHTKHLSHSIIGRPAKGFPHQQVTLSKVSLSTSSGSSSARTESVLEVLERVLSLADSPTLFNGDSDIRSFLIRIVLFVSSEDSDAACYITTKRNATLNHLEQH